MPLHTSPTAGAKGLVLFHGAGGDRDHRTFVRLESALDIPIERINFPYRQKGSGRRPPDRMPVLVDAVNEAVNEAAALWGIAPGDIAVGGRSMGGRAASIAHAEGLATAGLVLLSYPLHPPKDPKKLRVDHFGQISAPVLVIQGDKDPFGSPARFRYHLRKIPTSVATVWLKGANHSPAERFDDTIIAEAARWLH